MEIINKKITYDDNGEVFYIGRMGEHGVRAFDFDVSDYVQKFGNGRAEMLFLCQYEGTAFPVTMTRTGNVYRWVVSLSETQKKGAHTAVLRWYVGSDLAKSKNITCLVEETADVVTGTTPAPVQDWLDNFEDWLEEQLEDMQSESVSDEKIASAVATYLASHPIQTGLTETQVRTIVTGYGYLTQHQSLAEYLKKSVADTLYATATHDHDAVYLKEHQSLSGYVTTTALNEALLQYAKSSDVPTGNGMTTTQIDALCDILKEGVFGSNQNTAIESLRTSLKSNASSGGSSSGSTDSGSSDTPSTPTTPTLSSISATYSGGSVEAGTQASALTGITVTATYSDSTTATVTGWTISGTIEEGSNTLTISYSGKTATITVTGTASQTTPTESRNLINTNLVWVGKRLGTTTAEFNKLVDGDGYITVAIPYISGHKYIGMVSGQNVYTGSNIGISQSYTRTAYLDEVEDLSAATFDDFTVSTEGTSNVSSWYTFRNDESKYVTDTHESDNYMIVGISTWGVSELEPQHLMIYDYTEHGLLTTFESCRG